MEKGGITPRILLVFYGKFLWGIYEGNGELNQILIFPILQQFIWPSSEI